MHRPSALPAPLELVPSELEPVSAALEPDNDHTVTHSVLFPADYPEDLDGFLGDYRAGNPPEGSPIIPIIEGLLSRRVELTRIVTRNEGVKTEDTRRGLLAISIQHLLAKRIDKSFRNLQELDLPPEEAVACLETYVNVKTNQHNVVHNLEISTLIARKAGHDQGYVTRAMQNQRQVQTSRWIQGARNRLARVEFESLSSKAITSSLAEGL